jgi:hypothetical protein
VGEVWTKFGGSVDEVWRQRTKFGQIIANKKTIKVPMKIHVTKVHAKKKGARAKQAPALKDAKPDLEALIYNSKNVVAPRYYGCVTIYTDVKHNQWRVKPGVARRDEVKFPRNPASWRKLAIHVKSLKQY